MLWALAGAAAQEIENVELLIAQLGNVEFAVRQRAMVQLEAAGVAALPHLAKAAVSADAEVRSRAAAMLLAHAMSRRAEVRDAAREAIGQLNRSVDSSGGRVARGTLNRLNEILASAAVTELSRLGAVVTPVPGGPPLTYNIQLGQNWSGGNERLSLLAEAGDVPWLSMESAPVGDAALVHVAALAGKKQALTKLSWATAASRGLGSPVLRR